ncbi:thioredoxin family protein [Fuscovulum blasticum]|uniref:thioredoxin family protein n=1 Tax=Fuscovulum blasticum TaxID=1075 RepID=UPI0019D2ACD1|nr:thioredoxin family protein [Fuscovulum blasticum]
MATAAPVCDFGWKAPGFTLPGTDGKLWTLHDVAGPKGTLIVFMCNHCPYVKAILDRLVRDANDLRAFGIGVAAINANDAAAYPDDSFDEMKKLALPFPYLHDETQAVARAWGAACTPDFFGLNAAAELQYRGRLDSSGKTAAPAARRELYEAMVQIAHTGRGPDHQVAAMGCSIKWKPE